MHHSHFTKRGFQPVEGGNGSLMFLPLGQSSVMVESLEPRVTCGGTAPVEVLIIGSLFCPVGAAAVLYLQRTAAKIGDQVSLREIPAGPEALVQYGVAEGIFLNGRLKFFGPVTEAQVRTAITEEIRKAYGEKGDRDAFP